MDNVYLLSHSVHSSILHLPLLSVCIVDVLSSDFLYGTALLVLTYTLITQTARNPLLAPLPHQLFSSLCVCECECMQVCLFGRTSLCTRLSWIETGDVCCCVRNGVTLSGFACARVCVLGVGEDNTLETALNSRGLSSGPVASNAGRKVGGNRSSWSA